MVPLSKGKLLLMLCSLAVFLFLLSSFVSSRTPPHSFLLSSSPSSSPPSFSFSSDAAAPEAMMMRKVGGGAGERSMMGMEVMLEEGPSGSNQGGGDFMMGQGRMVARSASIEIQVNEPAKEGKKFEAFIIEKKGFISSFSDSGDSAFVNARVPAESLDEAIEFARKLAKLVIRVFKEGNDVTEEFVDQKARLKNAEAARDRLLELMEKAKEVQEILQIERELNQLTERIESFKARSEYLLQTTSLSSITLSLYKTYEPPVQDDSWSPFQTLKKAFHSLGLTLIFLVDFSIYLFVHLVPLLLVGGFVAFLWRGCSERLSK